MRQACLFTCLLTFFVFVFPVLLFWQVLAACKLAKDEIIWYCQHAVQGTVRAMHKPKSIHQSVKLAMYPSVNHCFLLLHAISTFMILAAPKTQRPLSKWILTL